MKIVHAVGWYFPESLGGTEVYVAGLARSLSRMGHEVAVAAPSPGSEEERRYEYEGIPVYRFPVPSTPSREECQGRNIVRGAELFHRWLVREAPDIVHFHSLVPGLGLPELGAAKKAGARVFVTCHSPGLGYLCQRGTLMRWGRAPCDGLVERTKCAACSLEHRGLPRPLAAVLARVSARVPKPLFRLPGRAGTALGIADTIAFNLVRQRELFRLVEKFVVLTRRAREVLEINGVPPEKLVVNPLGLSNGGLPRKPGPDLHPTSTPVRVGYVGRYDPIKGVYDLARAVRALRGNPSLSFEFRGPLNGPADRRVFVDLRRLLGDDPRVAFLPAVRREELPRVLASYDLVCCPSSCLEGGPTVAIEARAVGTPVVGTRIGGLAELVRDGLDGRVVEPGDWRALSRVLAELGRSPAIVDAWRARLPEPRTMDSIASIYLQLYERTARETE